MGYYSYGRRRHNFEITKREVLFSIAIIAVMTLIGFVIHGKISDNLMNEYQKYNTALQIDNNSEMFSYGMRTDIGNAFVHGDLKAVDTVTYPEIGGAYMYVEKIKEKYTMHTRTVTYTTGSGKTRQTHTRTETYWTWDRVDSEDIKCNEVSFCGVVFDSSKIELPDDDYIDTIKTSSHIRYKYYGIGTEYTGTIYTVLTDNTISNNTPFYNGLNIDETIDHLESSVELVIFWIVWIIVIIAVVIGFYYLDNKWLEDKKQERRGNDMDILRGDRLILTKEYDKMKMVGMTYEVANITETSVVMRDARTKIAVAALPIDVVSEYFEKPEKVKGWLPWTQIAGENGGVVGFYRTNGRKVQVRTVNNVRSEASCHGDTFNLFFGIRLAYLRCQQKYLNSNEQFLQNELNKVAGAKKDVSRTIKKMMESLEK